jgi:hypothetical protein
LLLDPTPSEGKLHSELDEPRIVNRIIVNRISDASKACRQEKGVRRSKLRTVEEIEKFGAELETQPLSRTECRSLKHSKIEIEDTLLAKPGIDARLVSERKCIWL